MNMEPQWQHRARHFCMTKSRRCRSTTWTFLLIFRSAWELWMTWQHPKQVSWARPEPNWTLGLIPPTLIPAWQINTRLLWWWIVLPLFSEHLILKEAVKCTVFYSPLVWFGSAVPVCCHHIWIIGLSAEGVTSANFRRLTLLECRLRSR